MVVKFLWEGYANKAPCDKVTQNYEIGGLKLVDLKSRDLALKISWVSKLTNREESSTSPLYYLLPIKDKVLWNCNIAAKDVRKLKIKSSLPYQFWEQWADFNHYTPCNVEEVMTQTLWFNSHIKRANKL